MPTLEISSILTLHSKVRLPVKHCIINTADATFLLKEESYFLRRGNKLIVDPRHKCLPLGLSDGLGSTRSREKQHVTGNIIIIVMGIWLHH